MSKADVKGTPQQEAIWKELRDGTDHMLVRARAGTGKTFTMVEGLKRVPNRKWKCGCVAFNRSIAKELQKKLPAHVASSTIHSLSYAAIRQEMKKVTVDDEGRKFKDIFFNVWATEMPYSSYGLRRECMPSMLKLGELAKQEGIGLGGDCGSPSLLEYNQRHDRFLGELMDKYGVVVPKGISDDLFKRMVMDMLADSLKQHDLIDFNDMIWFTALLKLPMQRFDLLMVDEAQDMNALQHELVDRAGERVVIVGDDRQAIYGFRGSDNLSMDTMVDRLEKRGSVVEMPLTVTWRCPKRVVELANELVPDYEAREDAPEGRILEPEEFSGGEVGDMVLCRTNAPIIGTFYELVRDSVPARVQGRDYGTQLVKVIKSIGGRGADEFMINLMEYHTEQRSRLDREEAPQSRYMVLQDKCECLRIIGSRHKTIEGMEQDVRRMFDDSKDPKDYVTLSSVHRAKGLEAKHVWVLNPELMPHPMANQGWEIDQEYNCCYVAVTRAMETLSLVGGRPACFSSSGFARATAENSEFEAK